MRKIKLAKYAVDDQIDQFYTRKLHNENSEDLIYRSLFEADRHRIINSSAFRRLQYKTQVFVNHQGDHYRTRLTHTLEVAQISRWIAGALDVNQDLSEIISLAHDLGHPPFGHAGEESLNKAMTNYGGFSHNIHTLKLITKIENRLIDFEGLNLTFATLEGVAKHNGKINLDDLEEDNYIKQFNRLFDLELNKNPSLEAQISAISDDIAYNNHDIEDGLRAQLFDVEELFDLPMVGEVYHQVLTKNPNIRNELLVGEAKKIITSLMVKDVIEQTKINILNNQISTISEVINHPKFLVEFSNQMQANHLIIKNFLMKKMYRHEFVNNMTLDGKKIIDFLFNYHLNNPHILPKERYHEYLLNQSLINLAKIICDFIAGMTDRYAIKSFKELNKTI
ncbi:MAG: deoxyguanosinetriphosphate triphosphohydrolase [Proteobacteria bacterium]|nr:deoxyguanosinetriphosphate triphosphohydrolase [Pseudomonadota bacterium]NCA28810.1 deoxyguanosinetriphosphate triphosphohydrolase [Pseudomonadota bacterium]